MQIKKRDNTVFLDAIVTSAAEHEEELMKSDFVKLSWSDSEQYVIPVDSYIIPYDDGVHYSLLEPYTPEQKSECEWKYEPKFQHPKMYLSKVTFKRPSKDSEANDITLLDWSYVGDIHTLLGYFCEQINKEFGFTGSSEIGYQVTGELNQNIATITFSTQDILSALTNTANQLECEWHIDWALKTLYFGRIQFLRSGSVPLLTVGDNIGVPSVRNSKEGYWNAFEPQGSTRNMTRRAASGEYVLANVRLSLVNNTYPDGIIYTDGNGNIISKSDFDARGETPYIKSLIFEDVYPKLDLYVYNVRYRERYLLEDNDDPESKVISHYDVYGNPIYKRYAVWYMNLAYPTKDVNGNVIGWTDFDISEARELDTTITQIISNTLEYHGLEIDLAIKVNKSFFTMAAQNNLGYVVTLMCDGIAVRGYVESYYFENDGTCRFYTEWSDGDGLNYHEPDLDNLTAFQNAIAVGKTITFAGGVDIHQFPKRYSQIIDGKELYGQFKVNTDSNAESSPLAGRGNGDNGNYGFGLIYTGIEGTDYVKEANSEPKEEGDTGVVDMNGQRDIVTDHDYEIVFQQSDDYILPTTFSQLIIPKGSRDGNTYIKDLSTLANKNLGLRGNIVNLYNIVVDSSYEASAKTELENTTKKYIARSVDDNNSYTFKSNPLRFSERLHKPLYIGQKVRYADNETYTEGSPLETRVMKLVTKLDYAFEQEITIGNEVLKGSQQSLKEQVQTMISFGAGGSGGSGIGGSGGGMSVSALRQAMKSLGAEMFISKVFDDEAEGNIEFNKNITIKGKGYADEMVSSEYTGEGMLDTGYRLWYENGRAKLVIDDLTARGKFSVYELETRIMTHAGGDVVFSGAGSKIFYVEYLNGDGESMGYTNINSPWMFNEKMLLAGVTGRAAWSNRRRIQKQLTQEQRAQVVKFRCYVYSDDGTMKTRNWWHTHDLARCQTFDHTQLKHNSEGYYSGENVTNTVYWRRVAGIGSKEIEGMDDGKIYDYFDLWNVLDVSQQTYYDPATETDIPIGYDIEETDPETGEVTYAYTTPGYDTNYNDWPAAGDQIVQFGNARDIDRQSMITLEVTGGEPGMKVYNGVHTYNMSGTKWVGLGYDATTKRAYADIFGDCYIGERGSVDPQDGSTYVRYNSGTKRLDIKAHITAASTYGEDDLSLENFIKGVTWTKDQIVDMIGEGVEIVQQQLDGNFTIWYGDATPTIYNDPASGWTTDQLKDEHLYDLFYDRTHDMGYRWSSHQDGDTVIYEWQRIPSNNNIIASLREAAHAQDTADGKRRVFLNTPVPPYDAGDLWVNADYRNPSTQAVIFDNDLVKCKTAKARGQQFSISDWEKASKYTDDSALDEFKGQRYVLELTNGVLRTDINSYQYVKDALSNETETIGGLMLTTMIGLRNKENGQYKTWGGINGAYQNGSTIAAWFGGGMVDYESLTTEQQAMGWDYYRWATSLFRMNGSGYVAGGNISWDDNGNVVIKGDRIGASQIYIGNQDITNYFVKKEWFDDIFQVFNDKTRIYTNDALPSDKSKMNIKAMFGFWTEFYLSALGTGGQTSLNIYLAQLGDVNTSGVQAGEYLMYDGTRWVSSSVGATTSLSALSDVSVSGVLNGQALVYNSTTQTWEPGTGGVDMASVWSAMSVASNEQINESHLSTALSTYAKTSQIPTNNNQLSNGAGYITSSALNGYATTTWVGQQGYLTSSSLNGYATTTWVGNNYLPLGGGNMSSGARIAFNGGNGYLGNSNNAGWLCVQDICSQASAGDGYWSIRTNGNAIFTNVYSYGAVSAQSDERKKDIVEDAGLSVEQVAEAPAKKFYWKDKRDEELHVGSIAQYWQKVLPEAVTDNNDALSMDYGVISLMSVIATARKVVEQEERIASLEKEIGELKNMLNLALRGNGS